MSSPKKKECDVLRTLAARVAEIAQQPAQQQRKAEWIAHNSLKQRRPMVLCIPEGSWLEAIPPEEIVCEHPVLHGYERRLRSIIFTWEQLGDDMFFDPFFNVDRFFDHTGWGLASKVDQPSGQADNWGNENSYYLHPNLGMTLRCTSQVGAYHVEPALANPDDLHKLVPDRMILNEEQTRDRLALAEDIFGDVLPVRLHGWYWGLSVGIASTAVHLRGMENLMFDVYDRPEWVHELVSFIARSIDERISAVEQAGLLSTNISGEWVGSGGLGATDELPAEGFDPDHVRTADMWGTSETQDLVSFSPAMMDEFFLPYIAPILGRFGLNCFGCCEPLHDAIGYLEKIPHLRRISISPWCDVAKAAERIGDRYVFSYKPNPAALSTPRFDEDALHATLVHDLECIKANSCQVEILMKDLHSINHEPDRLSRWVQLARRAIDDVYG